jgi:phosphatidylserine/phosphatidylglycerophosphate/cardiolipin synthase-like enzyme
MGHEHLDEVPVRLNPEGARLLCKLLAQHLGQIGMAVAGRSDSRGGRRLRGCRRRAKHAGQHRRYQAEAIHQISSFLSEPILDADVRAGAATIS